MQDLAWIAVTKVRHSEVDLRRLDRGRWHQVGLDRDPDHTERRRLGLDRFRRHLPFDVGKEAGCVESGETAHRQRLWGAGAGPAWLGCDAQEADRSRAATTHLPVPTSVHEGSRIDDRHPLSLLRPFTAAAHTVVS